MFKNLTIYRIAPGWAPDLGTMEASLLNAPFTECAPSQDRSIGFTDPRGTGADALVESVGGQRIMKLLIETKTVPASAINKRAKAAADHIEATQGRKPGRKEMKSLKEDAQVALLPQAFPRQSAVWVWIDPDAGLLMHDAGSQADTDEVVTALVRAFDGLALTLVQTKVTPQTAMTMWLASPDDAGLLADLHEMSIGRACELQSADEERARVSFKNHNLDTDEIRTHIREGKFPTRLALEWSGRVAFTLTEGMQLKKIEFLDGVFDGDQQADDGFDADVAIATGELRKLIPALVDALGGEIEPGAALPEGGAA